MHISTTIRNWALAVGVAGLCSLGAAAQSGQPTEPSSARGNTSTATQVGSANSGQLTGSDREFVRKAAEGGLAEVELGQLATQKASSPDVKQFGQRMVTDHTQANDQLKQIALQKGITVPTSLNAKDAATKQRLEGLSGAAFDRAYMQHMVKDHTKDVNEFQNEANNGKDSDVKSFASQTAPKLQEHLSMAQTVAGQTRGSASSSSSGSMGNSGSTSNSSTGTGNYNGR
jgi:putative membrane protein